MCTIPPSQSRMFESLGLSRVGEHSFPLPQENGYSSGQGTATERRASSDHVLIINRAGNRGVRVSVVFLQKLHFSALCWPNPQKFGTLWTWPKVISPPKNFPYLSTDGQENATFSLKVTNPHASIPSSADFTIYTVSTLVFYCIVFMLTRNISKKLC